jgi:NAD(P)-dependent dehydrogenase (short-subunit alcohol dehydrogenase family)
MHGDQESSTVVGLAARPLAGQVALVTGAASGIGRSIAVTLARAGADVVLADRNDVGLEETAAAARRQEVRVSCHSVDLAQSEAVEVLAHAALTEWGGIDILVNCAGIIGELHWIVEADLVNWNRVFAVNVTAPLILMRHVGKQMIARGGGRIVNITSSSAHRAKGALPAYAASKSALMQLTRSAAAELGEHGITVNAVAPGVTETPIVTGIYAPGALDALVRSGPASNLTHRVSKPEDVAHAVLFLCLPGARQITAQTIHTSAGAVV